MVATNVRPHCEEANPSIAEWRKQWECATFGSVEVLASQSVVSEDDVHDLLAEFGSQVMDPAKPVWQIQADALLPASLLKYCKTETGYSVAQFLHHRRVRTKLD